MGVTVPSRVFACEQFGQRIPASLRERDLPGRVPKNKIISEVYDNLMNYEQAFPASF